MVNVVPGLHVIKTENLKKPYLKTLEILKNLKHLDFSAAVLVTEMWHKRGN
jgi:hypothetical protein